MFNDIINGVDPAISDTLDDELFYTGGSFVNKRFQGQFTRAYVDQGNFQSYSPMVLCNEGVFDFKEDEEISFDGTNYKIANAKPDGDGLIEVVLKNA